MKSKLFKSLFQTDSAEMLYVHVAPSIDVVNSVLQSGFYYDDIFQKTTDQLLNSESTFDYWLYQRRAYGNYAIVFGFDKGMISQVKKHIQTTGRHIELQNLISYSIPESHSPIEGEDIHCLPSMYVKGWFKLSDFSWNASLNYCPAAFPSTLVPVFKEQEALDSY